MPSGSAAPYLRTGLRPIADVVRVPVQGGSMRPLIDDGDHVRVRTGVTPSVGDVVVALTGTGLIVHRLVRRSGDHCILCGDDVARSDVPVHSRQLLGRVVAVEGERGRRMDGPVMRMVGRAAAALALGRRALGERPSRPRPGCFGKAYLRAAEAWPPPPTAEDRLAVLLAGPASGAAAAGLAGRLVDAGIQWPRLAERALLGQIGPTVFVGARRLLEASTIPPGALDPLRRQYIGNFARSRQIADILAAMVDRLDALGIPVMAHKGIALAACVYDEPALRVMGDIDLCVRDADRERAESAVADIRDELVRANPDRRSLSGFHVELDGTGHHDLDPRRFGAGRWRSETLDWEGIWRQARPARLGSCTVLVPCPNDLVLTLIANSLRRGCSPVRTIVDLARTVERFAPELDWPALESELRRTCLDRRAWIALQLAVEWCRVDVPARLLEPPEDLRTAIYERVMLDWKRRRPFARLPSRILWAGSWAEGIRVAARLGYRGVR